VGSQVSPSPPLLLDFWRKSKLRERERDRGERETKEGTINNITSKYKTIFN
jgi:hypothetical protein